MAKELQTCHEFENENQYKSVLKLVIMFELRKHDLFNGKDLFGVKCPDCGHVMEETYYYHIGDFRLRFECPNHSCGFACNSWGLKELQERIKTFESIRETQKMVDDGVLPF